jgi:hypothetical protein
VRRFEIFPGGSLIAIDGGRDHADCVQSSISTFRVFL